MKYNTDFAMNKSLKTSKSESTNLRRTDNTKKTVKMINNDPQNTTNKQKIE